MKMSKRKKAQIKAISILISLVASVLLLVSLVLILFFGQNFKIAESTNVETNTKQMQDMGRSSQMDFEVTEEVEQKETDGEVAKSDGSDVAKKAPWGQNEPEKNGAEEETEIEKKEIEKTEEAWIYEKMQQMTLEQKVAQLFIVTPESITGVETAVSAGGATKQAISKYPVSGIIYFSKNIQSSQQIQQMLENTWEYGMEINGIPMFLSVDEEGGSVARIANHPQLNVTKVGNMSEIGSGKDAIKAYEAGNIIGSYLSELGFNLDFAPVADVLSNTENQVVKSRSFGADANIVSEMDTQFLRGLDNNGICGVLKHFPGHGATVGDTHEGYAYTDKTLEELMENEWVPFIDGIDGGVSIIMVGHISTPAITNDELPASLSKEMIDGILRKHLGFEGVVITDALNMGAIQNTYTSAQSAVKSIQAGTDILLMPADFQSAYNGIIEAVKDGELTEERIDESIYRILKVKYNLRR